MKKTRLEQHWRVYIQTSGKGLLTRQQSDDLIRSTTTYKQQWTGALCLGGSCGRSLLSGCFAAHLASYCVNGQLLECNWGWIRSKVSSMLGCVGSWRWSTWRVDGDASKPRFQRFLPRGNLHTISTSKLLESGVIKFAYVGSEISRSVRKWM